MKPTIVSVIGAALLALTSVQLVAAEKPEPSPEATAANFIGMLYGVKAEKVAVTIIKREGFNASAVAVVDDRPTFTLDMAEAPEYVVAPYGWLVGGMACDKISSSSSEG